MANLSVWFDDPLEDYSPIGQWFDEQFDVVSVPTSYPLDVTVGNFILTGTTTELLKNNRLDVTVNTFVLAGIDVDLTYIPVSGALELTCQPGIFAWTGISSIFNKQIVLNNTTGTFIFNGINNEAVKNYPIVALPQSYLVGTTGIDYFSTQRLEASTAPFVMRLQSNGDFFWYQTTKTIPIIKPRLINRNQWILGRATHMGRRGL